MLQRNVFKINGTFLVVDERTTMSQTVPGAWKLWTVAVWVIIFEIKTTTGPNQIINSCEWISDLQISESHSASAALVRERNIRCIFS